jgi:Tfp pilus assembly protein PilV
MTPPARPTPPSQEGFILIEVLVSALILAIVAGAVLSLITATTHSAASERNHSTAFGLAQENLARLQTMRLSGLNQPIAPTIETVGGTTFTVESKGVFVNNSTGTVSCTAANSSSDYVEITSTVSSATLPHPVSLQSIVSPSTGSLDPSHGTLAFQVNNAAGKPVSGVKISGTGSTSFTGSSDENGCANFADLPSGNYKVTINAGALINQEGNSSEIRPAVPVPASSTQQEVLHFDRAGGITPKFVYTEPGTKKTETALIDSMMVFESEGGKPATLFGTPGTNPTSTTPLTAHSVYPFETPYAVYAGSCVKDKPEPATSKAIGNVKVEPGLTAT